MMSQIFLVLVLIICNLSYLIWVWLTLFYFALQVNFKLSFQNHSNDFTETHILKVSSLNGRREIFFSRLVIRQHCMREHALLTSRRTTEKRKPSLKFS